LTNKRYFDKWYPADMVTECGPGQYRCWFYSMLLHGVFLTGKAPFKSIMTNELVKGEDGREMHKSWGNAIWFDEAADKVGTDVMRWKYSTHDIAKELWFGWKGLEEQKRNLNVLWNLANYLQVGFGKDFKPGQPRTNTPADRWILSKLESLKKKVNANLEALQPHLAALELQDFFLNTFSREYVHFVREILSEESKEKETVLQVMYKVMCDLLKLLAPFIPFTTEKIYLDIFKKFQKEESIHLFEWPEFDEKKIDVKLETEIKVVQELTSTIFALREKLQRSVRWPIKSAIIVTEDHDVKNAVEKQKDLIKTLANVNSILLTHKLEGIKHVVKPNHSTIAPKAKKQTTEVIAHFASQSPESILHKLKKEKKIVYKDIEFTEADFIIEEKLPSGVMGLQVGSYSLYLETEETKQMLASGFARELTRAVQALRKTAGLSKPDRIKLTVSVDRELENMLAPFLKEIKEKVGARDIEFSVAADVKRRKYKGAVIIRKKTLNFGFDTG